MTSDLPQRDPLTPVDPDETSSVSEVSSSADLPAPAPQDAVTPSQEPAAPASSGARRWLRWRPSRRIVGGAVVAGLLVAGGTVPVNKVIESPGPTWNVLSGSQQGSDAATTGADGASGGSEDADVLTVTGTQTYPTDGALRMTTVSVQGCPGHKVTAFDLVAAWFQSERTVLDREQVCPSSMSAEQVEQSNQAQMTSSQDAAVVAALMETGLASSMVLTVAQVADAQQGTDLKAGDVLTSITPEGGEQTTFTTYGALRKEMETLAPGTRVEVGLVREGQALTTSLTTIAPQEGSGRTGSLLGVALSVSASSQVQASFGLSDVGGPSAGTMFALGIIDEVTPGDLTGGKDVAGTGTISVDGEVGAIGGIKQKMAGARKDGSRYFLAPSSNCSEVVGNVPEGMEVYAVSTLSQAVSTVEAIAEDRTSSLSTCEAVLASDSASAASAGASTTPSASSTP